MAKWMIRIALRIMWISPIIILMAIIYGTFDLEDAPRWVEYLILFFAWTTYDLVFWLMGWRIYLANKDGVIKFEIKE